MANVSKICEIIFGANPTDADLREIVRRVEAKLPQDDGSVTLTLDKLDAFEQRIYRGVAQAITAGVELALIDKPTTDAAVAPRVSKK